MRPVKFLDLAASGAPDIAIAIYQALSYLKPLYLDNTFAYKGPKRLLEAVDIPAAGPEPDDYGFFDRTLIAYCKAYVSPQLSLFCPFYREVNVSRAPRHQGITCFKPVETFIEIFRIS